MDLAKSTETGGVHLQDLQDVKPKPDDDVVNYTLFCCCNLKFEVEFNKKLLCSNFNRN